MVFGFFRQKRNNQAIVERQYAALTSAARTPAFYLDMNAPDTVMGRFEMLTIMLILYFRRTARSDRSGQEIAQNIIDAFFEDVDHSIRELGVGDPGVPKRMKKLASMYYGRLESYAGALDKGDHEALAAALARNLHPEVTPAPDMKALADWMFTAEQALSLVEEPEIETGMARIAVPAS
ncbi:ubiquinol-cytochrome C chaperone [Rhizobium sp. Root274]|uniref:ubiquinol-cytochrome C chaperone family protein n=1 Tax=unclassified Rhizobium TaxID=2613769 RepID=UPI0007124D71|nr:MULTISPECIES: ubiquinol-cytochrome C chaperone family protein [unclassified Rhizobium]KQW30928.1 ubiquinol-cytochrome C chaperone [Rhizobium sp. Root1240]KRD32472.1 ubiquinol-cytochrome C chaperone [Rhizobium sp. Root274]